MAFPASPSNNQVHKETNGKTFVYDSALGTWDRVADTDKQEGQVPQGSNDYFEGVLTDATTFPGGHIIQVVQASHKVRTGIDTTSTTYVTTGLQVRIIPKVLRSKILLMFSPWMGVVATATSGANFMTNIERSGSSVNDAYVWGEESASTTTHHLYQQSFEAAPRTWNAQGKNQRFIQFLDEPKHSNITAYINYELRYRLGSGYNAGISANYFCGCTAMEVMSDD